MRGLEDQVDFLKIAIGVRSVRNIAVVVYRRHSPSLGLDEREVDDDDAQRVEGSVEQIEAGACQCLR